MAEWEHIALGELIDISHGFAFKGEYFTEEATDFWLLTPGNFAAGGGFRYDKKKFYDGPVPEGFILQPGELLVTMTDLSRKADTLGYPAIIPDDPGAQFLHNQRLGRVKVRKPDRVDCRFLFYLLCSREYRHEVLASATGTTVKHTSPKRILAFEAKLPPMPVQRAIARVLGALDDKNELNRKMNHTLEATAQAIFRSWFVEFDPVVARADGREPFGMNEEMAALFPDRFVESELGPIPSGWGVKTLKELTSKIGSGATPKGGKASYVDEGIALVRSQNVYDSDFRWDGLARITDEQAERLSSVTLELNDVLLNITGASILRTCVVDPDVLPARVNQHVAIIRARSGIPPRFLHQHLLRPDIKSTLFGMNAGGSREAITKAHIESVQLPVPSRPLLDCFARITDPIFAKKELNRSESRALADLLDLLLPKLLSGEIRVGEAEELAGEAGA